MLFAPSNCHFLKSAQWSFLKLNDSCCHNRLNVEIDLTVFIKDLIKKSKTMPFFLTKLFVLETIAFCIELCVTLLK